MVKIFHARLSVRDVGAFRIARSRHTELECVWPAAEQPFHAPAETEQLRGRPDHATATVVRCHGSAAASLDAR